jgi:hypothetical protein
MHGNDSAAWVRGGAIDKNQDPADGISACGLKAELILCKLVPIQADLDLGGEGSK